MRDIQHRFGFLAAIAILFILNAVPGTQSLYSIRAYGEEVTKKGAFDQSYRTYNALLQKYVSNGRVDYEGFIGELEAFLEQVGSVDPEDFGSWSENDKLAYWINAYNAFTVKAIIDHYPIKRSFSLVGIFYAPSNSILQIKGVWTKLQFKAVGRMVTLDEIEHQILRKEFDEPRIHMAIVCASVSCPDLSSEAYTGDTVREQLGAAAVRFVNNPDKGVFVDEKSGRVKVSKIFKWFGDDFIKNYGDGVKFEKKSLKDSAVLNFILYYTASESKKKYIEKDNFKLGYLKYDWHLNEMPGT